MPPGSSSTPSTAYDTRRAASSRRTLSKPDRVFAAAASPGDGRSGFDVKYPHARTSGPTVGSKVPEVSSKNDRQLRTKSYSSIDAENGVFAALWFILLSSLSAR